MTDPNAEQFRLMMVQNFLDDKTCEHIIRALKNSAQSPATVYGSSQGGKVDDRVRKVTQVTPSTELQQQIMDHLVTQRSAVGAHFGISLKTCEPPQFLRYQIGDFFVAHQDGNTGLIKSEREESRKISIVIFLNDQSDGEGTETYAGGDLLFRDWRKQQEFPLRGERGLFVAFPAETTHEVVAVTRGERFSIVSWYG